MAWRTQPTWWLTILLAVGLSLGLAPAAQAGHEDAALFYEELSQYGNWVDYGTYGPVWYPSNVSANWRPYLDGRWVPNEGGWIFETGEPWGWATYHYGNWMPTTEYGWVWCPGRTWYPSTAAWRTSDEYVGWAPIPPPNYVPPPAYYPPGGYYPGISALDLITAPFWIFAQAASFLLGFGNPYAPSYSYYNCGCLVPVYSYPVIFPRTFFLTEYWYPAYAPRGFFFFGPSFHYVSRVCRIPLGHFHTITRRLDVRQVRNALPPQVVLKRRPYLTEALPVQVREGRWQVRRLENVKEVKHVARPDVVSPPREIPAMPKLTRVTPKVPEPPAVAAPKPREAPAEKAKPAVPEPTPPKPPEVLRPPKPERKGVQLPPQAVPGEREMRDQLRRERRQERTFPPEQQRRFQRQEQELKRQEIFRTPRVTRPEPPAPRMRTTPAEPRRAPELRPQPQTPRQQMAPPRPAPSRSGPEGGRLR